MKKSNHGYTTSNVDVLGKQENLNEKLQEAFFLSSRRRHTISKRDWSSDVCSSDLLYDEKNRSFYGKPAKEAMKKYNVDLVRSEERRVGKE